MAEEAVALLPEIRDLVESEQTGEAAARLASLHPADAADILVQLDDEARLALIPSIPRVPFARIIEYLPDEDRGDIIDAIPDDALPSLLDEIDDDIVADILHQVGSERSQGLLSRMSRAAQVLPLLRHSDETAGGHMTRAYIALNGNWTAERAIQYLRRVRPDADSAYYLYIVDPGQRLEGVVSLRDLIIAAPTTPLSEIMNRDVARARDEMDQEEMARLVQRYDLVALPVVDAQDRLVGVITVDDVLDVVEEEATEDILKLAGVGVRETALGPLTDSVRRRIPWLLANMCVALAAAFVVSRFEDTIAEVAALAAIMPIIAGQGGNAGIQTSTIIVRGLALEEIDRSDVLRVLGKEIALGLVKGVIFGSALTLIAWLWFDNGTLALIAGGAMLLNMLVASVGGTLIPITLRYVFRVDPATAAGVFDTMLTDIMGFFIFLGLATLLLSQLQ